MIINSSQLFLGKETGFRFNSLSSPGQGMPGFSGTHGNTVKKEKKRVLN